MFLSFLSLPDTGNAFYKVGISSVLEPDWAADDGIVEIEKQLLFNENNPEVKGSVLFRHLSLNDPMKKEAVNMIKNTLWVTPVLIPSMPSKEAVVPRPPIKIKKTTTPDGVQLTSKSGDQSSENATLYYAIYKWNKNTRSALDRYQLLNTVRRTGLYETWLDRSPFLYKNDVYIISALNRNHVESLRRVFG